MRVQPFSGTPALECTLVDGSGAINVVFLGRRAIAGVGPGTVMVVEGTVGRHRGLLAVINPEYELVADTGRADTGS